MSTIDVVVVPTFAAAHASPPTPPITLRSVDMKTTTLFALRRAIHSGLAAHLSQGPNANLTSQHKEVSDCGTTTEDSCEPQPEEAASVIATDVSRFHLLVGGIVLDQPESTVLADIAGVAAAVKMCTPEAKRQPGEAATDDLVFPTLTVYVSERPAPYCITLRINVAGSRVPLFVTIPITSTIAELRKECAIAASVPEHDVVLYPSPAEEPFTDHHRALLECGFENGGSVYMERRSQSPPPPISIFVKTLTGVTVECKLNEHALVDTLKLDLQAKTAVPPEQMRFIFAVKHLEDGHSLSEYGVVPYSRVELVLRLRGNGHTGIPPSDASLFFMTFATRPNSTAVKIVDAIGTILFVQNGVSITLARPCLGALHVWLSSGESCRKSNYVGGEIVQLDDMAEPHVRCQHFSPTYSEVALTVSQKTINVQLDLDQCNTADEVLQAFFAQVAAVLPQPVVEQGFNVFLVRPSGAEVLVDGIEPLLSPLNARKTLVVRKVARGAQPAVNFSSESDDSDPDTECPPR